ncbi:MAG: 50S ribosomal protein L35 [Chthoniobacterales bacterium]
MPRSIARRKTKKSFAKRFKVTGTGKILRSKAGRRHLLSSKSPTQRRRLGKAALVDKTDMNRVREALPFG